MSDYIQLPRSALTDEMERNGDLARLLIYLLRRVDENGEIKTDMTEIAKDLVLSRQTVRTLMKKILANQILTKSSTTRITKLKFEYQEIKPKRQPRKQPNQQPNTNQIKTSVPDYISPPFVAPEFREIWQRFTEYRKEIKKPYKSESSERTAYFKMVEMSGNNPAVAKDMVERSILGQWQGLYKDNSNDKRNNNQQNRNQSSGRGQYRNPTIEDIARGLLEESSR